MRRRPRIGEACGGADRSVFPLLRTPLGRVRRARDGGVARRDAIDARPCTR
jgi:hypothetical protein